MFILELLMGGIAGTQLADHYEEQYLNFPPNKGEIMCGNLEWHDACPYIDLISNLLEATYKSTCVIQLGASSGREIAYLA